MFSEKILKIFRFLFIGGSTFVLNYLILIFCKEILKYADNVSVTIAYFMGIIYHFSMNKFFVFKEGNIKTLLRQLPQYATLTLINYLINLGVVNLFSMFSITVYVAVVVATFMTLFLTYFVFNRIIFNRKKV
jgi:putative flippase GtrA